MEQNNGQGWGSWLASKVNPWSGEQAARQQRNQQRDTNQRVVNTKSSLSDLKKKRQFLVIKAKKIKQKAMAPNVAQQDAVRLANEYRHIDAEIKQLDAVLRNVQGATSALDTTTTNVQAFEAMRDAQEGLETVTQQVQPHQIDEVMSKLQTNVDDGKQIGRAMSQELDWGIDDAGYESISTSEQASADLLSSWRNEVQAEGLPDAPVGRVPQNPDAGNGGGEAQPQDANVATNPQQRKI